MQNIANLYSIKKTGNHTCFFVLFAHRCGHGLQNRTIRTLENFYISEPTGFFKNDDVEVVNLPLLEEIKVLDLLEEEEKQTILKFIDMAITKKKLKDNLQSIANL